MRSNFDRVTHSLYADRFSRLQDESLTAASTGINFNTGSFFTGCLYLEITMEITHCLTDAKHIRRFLDACDGNWHRCIYINCVNCRVKNPCNQSGFLFCPDYRAVPLVLPLSDADILFACRPEPGECLAVFKDSVFLDMYAQFLKEQKILSPDCPCMALLDIQNKDCYDW